jgi:AraC-like DNA-binding protein
LARPEGWLAQIWRTIQWIRERYTEPFRVEQIAATVDMSVAAFYRHFKAVTAMTPIQYQKRLRLPRARWLLLLEPRDAASIAFSVGDENASQFNRDMCACLAYHLRVTSPGQDTGVASEGVRADVTRARRTDAGTRINGFPRAAHADTAARATVGAQRVASRDPQGIARNRRGSRVAMTTPMPISPWLARAKVCRASPGTSPFWRL